MVNDMSSELYEYLGRCGLPSSEVAKCSSGTRMYHDLGLYGDIAEAYMSVLVDYYHVDLSDFEFEKYFPQEFVGKNMLIRTLFWILPFAGDVVRRHGEYLPLTLEMVDRAIRTKRFTA
jgi:hypothetical protein